MHHDILCIYMHFLCKVYFSYMLCWSLFNGIFYSYFMHISAYLLHMLCICYAYYICIFWACTRICAYNLHICYVGVYVMAHFVHVLVCKCILNAYSWRSQGRACDISHSPDIELGVNMGKSRPNYVAPHVVKPPTVDWLGFTDKVSAAIAVTNKSTNKSSTPPTKAPGWVVGDSASSKSSAFLPLLCAGRAPSIRHRWPMAECRLALHCIARSSSLSLLVINFCLHGGFELCEPVPVKRVVGVGILDGQIRNKEEEGACRHKVLAVRCYIISKSQVVPGNGMRARRQPR